MIIKTLLLILIFAVAYSLNKLRFQKRLNDLQLFGIQFKFKGDSVFMKITTSEGIYEAEGDKEMFFKQMNKSLEEAE